MKKKKKEAPTSVKGMRDLIDAEYYRYEGFLEKASEIALYYGFKPIETPILEKKDVFTSGVGEETDIVQKEMYELKTKGGDSLVLRPEGTASIVRAYTEHGMQSWPHPVMLYYKGPFFRHENPQRGRYRQFWQFGIECLGSTKSVMDAMVIHTMVIILREAGVHNLCVKINSIGDKESRMKYTKELTTYYKKLSSKICSDCQKRIRTNPLRVLDCKQVACQPIKEDAPTPIASLTPVSRDHFKEVLEYLEALGVDYRIDNHLVRGLDYYSETVFEFVEYLDPISTSSDSDEPIEPIALALGGGGRYDHLAKELGSKKDVPAVGASIGVDRVLMLESYKQHDPRIIKKPKVFFIQLGFEAKLKSLKVIEILRKAKVPITQTLNKDGLSQQLALVEKLAVPYAIIFGQKESLEDTVIVRNMTTHSQETIKIDELSKYISKLK